MYTHLFSNNKVGNTQRVEEEKRREIRNARFYIFFGYIDSIIKLIFIFCTCKSFNVLHIENVLEIWFDAKMCRCTMLHSLYLGI